MTDETREKVKKEPRTRKVATRPRKPRAARPTKVKETAGGAGPVVRQREAPRAPARRTYLFAVGRRKSAVARVRFTPGSQTVLTVNGQPVETYFGHPTLIEIACSPLGILAGAAVGAFSIKTAGGGKHGQAEAVRHGIARVLVLANPEARPTLKHAGFLTRDPRVKERKKYGLKRARRAPQWQKR